MTTQTLLKAISISLLIFGWTSTAFAQGPSNASTPAPATSTPTPGQQTQIVYTGKLLGYFRVPSLQDFKAPQGCSKASPDNDTAKSLDSDAAEIFLKERGAKYPNAILVGTGDNFAPQLEARVFSNPPPQNVNQYAVGNKELFSAKGAQWIFYDQVKFDPPLQVNLERGLGTIPTDNVACFLRAAKYDAIVPGKHDFYFGPERLRQLARFLASDDPQSGLPPVQMLAANLVMKTVPIEASSPSPKIMKDKWFEDWPKDISLANLKDGATVYPWFSYVKFPLLDLNLFKPLADRLRLGFENGQIKKEEQDFEHLANEVLALAKEDCKPEKGGCNPHQNTNIKALTDSIKTYDNLKKRSFWVCASTGDPNEIPENRSTCRPVLNPKVPDVPDVRLVGNNILYYITLPLEDSGRDNHFSTLTRAENYGLCTDGEKRRGCLRFSVHTPFFYFPHKVAKENADGYRDPEPFVLKNENVAIFGVVDPDLSRQVGILNFGWKHGAKLTTKVSVEDPAEALQQQLDYFDYYEFRRQKTFKGLRILLAQTPPQQARALAARFPEFQVVVSAADQEQGTSELETTTNWKLETHRPFVAVPTPYFDTATRQGNVYFGNVTATNNDSAWTLQTSVVPSKNIPEPEDQADGFWNQIKTLRGCLPKDLHIKDDEDTDRQTYLKWLVLCSMREATQADVALIQKRDLYDKLPVLLAPSAPAMKLLNRSAYGQKTANTKSGADQFENTQQMLDRLIWKGDFLTLLYLPGSDLKKALDRSGEFASEEKATFSLGAEKGRQLEMLGVTEDNDEYIINGLPLNEDRLYAVATTDYLVAGDTGYPDLAKAAVNPRTHPAAFDKPLIGISSLVCRKLFSPPDAIKYCLGPVIPEDYLDTTTAKRAKTYRDLGFFTKMWEASPFKWPSANEKINTLSLEKAVEEYVQRRPIWTLSLKQISVAFSGLYNNLSKDEIKAKFSGVPATSSVTNTENRTWNVDIDTRLSRSSRARELFLDWGVEYKRVATGEHRTDLDISQEANRVFWDPGFIWWRRPGRAAVNIGAIVSMHIETPLQRPFTVFTLNNDNKDRLKVNYNRNLQLFPRLGVRWQNRKNSFEFGFQAGKERDVLRGYRFETNGVVTAECAANPAKPISDCVDDKSGGTPPTITAASVGSAILQDSKRAGAYWKGSLSIPIALPIGKAKIKYEFEDEANFFFVNFHRDTNVDTRFLDRQKHKISVPLWPSVSIGPKLELLIFQNKVNRDFLIQRTFGIELTVSLDIFNRREIGAQAKYKPGN